MAAKILRKIDPNTFNAGDPAITKELRKASKKEAFALVQNYIASLGLKRIADVDSLVKDVIRATGTALSVSTIKDACYETRQELFKQEGRVFQRAFNLAFDKFKKGFNPSQIMTHFECVLPFTRNSDISEMSKNSKWAAILKARDLYQKTWCERQENEKRMRQEFNRPLEKALKEATAS